MAGWNNAYAGRARKQFEKAQGLKQEEFVRAGENWRVSQRRMQAHLVSKFKSEGMGVCAAQLVTKKSGSVRSGCSAGAGRLLSGVRRMHFEQRQRARVLWFSGLSVAKLSYAGC